MDRLLFPAPGTDFSHLCPSVFICGYFPLHPAQISLICVHPSSSVATAFCTRHRFQRPSNLRQSAQSADCLLSSKSRATRPLRGGPFLLSRSPCARRHLALATAERPLGEEGGSAPRPAILARLAVARLRIRQPRPPGVAVARTGPSRRSLVRRRRTLECGDSIAAFQEGWVHSALRASAKRCPSAPTEQPTAFRRGQGALSSSKGALRKTLRVAATEHQSVICLGIAEPPWTAEIRSGAATGCHAACYIATV